MTDNTFFQSFGRYAPGALLVAFAVVIGMGVLKRTLLKGKKSYFVTFLPFLLGVVFYAVYYCAVTLSLGVFLEHAEVILQNGLATGALATAINAALDRLTGNTTLSGVPLLVYGAIKDFPPLSSFRQEEVEELAIKIAAAVSEEDPERDAERVKALLIEFCGEHACDEEGVSLSKDEAELLAKLVMVTLRKNGK